VIVADLSESIGQNCVIVPNGMNNPIVRYVAPIFRESGRQQLAFCGSAVLVEGPNGSPWLVSAAHVLAEMDHSQLVIAADSSAYYYLVAEGNVLSTCELTPPNAAHDEKDLAFVRLHPAIANQLHKTDFKFLSVEQTDVGGNRPLAEPCVLDGYPRQFVKIENGRPQHLLEMRTKSILLPDADVAKRFKLKANLHLLAPFAQLRDEEGKPMKTPDPDGMSGGAIWTMWPDGNRLAGIIIEHDRHRGEIVGSRIGPLVRELTRRATKPKELS
jgi:hypothetical protein